MCKIVVTTNGFNVWYTCEDCVTTLQNPDPVWPSEWLEEHCGEVVRQEDMRTCPHTT